MEWEIAYAPNYLCKGIEFNTIDDILNSGYSVVSAKVPESLEEALMRTGELPDLYYGMNVFKAQEFENIHTWYFAKFDCDNLNSFLKFEGIDTIADIYVNGKYMGRSENMSIPFVAEPILRENDNEIIVHVFPTCIVARDYKMSASCISLDYNYDSLYIRKAPHMFGWDIMPRIVSGGLWKPVEIIPRKTEYIDEAYLYTLKIEKDDALLTLFSHICVVDDNIHNYYLELSGKCGDSTFLKKFNLWSTNVRKNFNLQEFKLWWPKNSGEQNLYDISLKLFHNNEVCDEKKFKFGIRTIELNRTETTTENGAGEFCFKVNGRNIFVLGTNWVPLDAFHSNDVNRLKPALELLDDIGCNMVRCWGGNVYESDEFFEFCDEKGIMVWQDFSMGCGIYPQDSDFLKKIEEEAIYIIKRLRQFTSLVLWAGDNECDQVYRDNNFQTPDNNYITRAILPRAIYAHDITRPFLPSSPFISTNAFESKMPISEDHLWGPRDYFKGNFYGTSVCHFASETGYHGCPSPKSLAKFLSRTWPWKEENGKINEEWLAHSTCPEKGEDNCYAYRIQLMADQIKVLFGSVPDNLDDFAIQSQISQAEAKKYFIERFRVSKWRRTGIIWWNLIDGWPQISDAVVDYYHTKKLAYYYIKRSQNPLCLMFDEPINGKIALYGVNDTQKACDVEYKVTDVTEEKIVASGNCLAKADKSTKFMEMGYKSKHFYLIEWNSDGISGKNHFFTDIIDIDYGEYMKAIKKCNFDEFEGF